MGSGAWIGLMFVAALLIGVAAELVCAWLGIAGNDD